jgi:hypothetical protein
MSGEIYTKTYDAKEKTVRDLLSNPVSFRSASTQRKFSKTPDWVCRHIHRAVERQKNNKKYDVGRFISYRNLKGEIIIYDGQSRLITMLFILIVASHRLEECKDELQDFVFEKKSKLTLSKNINVNGVKIPKIIPRFEDDKSTLTNILYNDLHNVDKKGILYNAYQSVVDCLSKMEDQELLKFIAYYLESDLVMEDCLSPIDAADRMEIANMEGVPFTEVEAMRTHLMDVNIEQDESIFERFERLINKKVTGGKYKPDANMLKGAALRYNNKLEFCTMETVMKTRYKISSAEESTRFLNEMEHTKLISEHIYKYRPHVRKFGNEFMYNGLVQIFNTVDDVKFEYVDLIMNIAISRVELSFNPIPTHQVWFPALDKFKSTHNISDLPQCFTINVFKNNINAILSNEIRKAVDAYNDKKSKSRYKQDIHNLLLACFTKCKQSSETDINWSELDNEHISSLECDDNIPIEKKMSLGNLLKFSAKNNKNIDLKGNRSLKNGTFDKKKLYYAKSSIHTVKEVSKLDTFTSDVIDSRTEDTLVTIWNNANFR